MGLWRMDSLRIIRCFSDDVAHQHPGVGLAHAQVALRVYWERLHLGTLVNHSTDKQRPPCILDEAEYRDEEEDLQKKN